MKSDIETNAASRGPSYTKVREVSAQHHVQHGTANMQKRGIEPSRRRSSATFRLQVESWSGGITSHRPLNHKEIKGPAYRASSTLKAAAVMEIVARFLMQKEARELRHQRRFW